MAKKTLLITAVFMFVMTSFCFAEDTASSLTLIDASVCQSIENRNPVGVGDVFPSDIARVFCFTKAGSLEVTKIKHLWYYKDEKVAEIALKIGASASWRTRSSKAIMAHQTGNWKVEIVASDNKVLKTIQFMVE
ncbi:MAG: DUF2914 domain-containing protein [Desulfobacterales bacterium]|nr:DUF2914 domain-containing protein [Desulfobacterales bacterium]MCP4158578.1 DUF2914 domain-containing protein [Deltaproteobacteria bacterium]